MILRDNTPKIILRTKITLKDDKKCNFVYHYLLLWASKKFLKHQGHQNKLLGTSSCPWQHAEVNSIIIRCFKQFLCMKTCPHATFFDLMLMRKEIWRLKNLKKVDFWWLFELHGALKNFLWLVWHQNKYSTCSLCIEEHKNIKYVACSWRTQFLITKKVTSPLLPTLLELASFFF